MGKINKKDLILALLMAVVLWAYVLGELDPVKTAIMRNVPIEFINEDYLAQEGMIVTDKEYTTVSITYSGKRSNLGTLKMSDFKVVANVSGATVGNNEIAIDASAPSYVTIENVSIKHLNVIVDELVTEKKPIEVEVINQTSDDSEPYIMQTSMSEADVTGAKALVSRVIKLEAKLDASRVGNELKSLSVDLVPVDSYGNIVEGVDISNSSVSVSAVLHNKKTVELITPVEGLDSGSVTRVVNAPKTITIKGADSVLSQIKEITAEVIDVSNVYEDCEVEVVPILSKGVTTTADSSELIATVKVFNAAVGEYKYDETDVEVVGINGESIATLGEASITVKVKGTSQVISQAESKDFTLQVNAEGLTDGNYNLPIICKTDIKELADITVEPGTISVTIEKASEAGDGEQEHSKGSETDLIDNNEEEQ